jgi:ribonuclease HI
MAGKKVYAIAAGRKPGIYDSWPEAKAQIDGFAGARYKGFATREEALAWIDSPAAKRPYAGPGATAPPVAKPAKTAASEGEALIYSDGGARNNPGPGGYGVVLLIDGERREMSGGYRLTTNNRMELMGCIVALRQLAGRDMKIELYTDSSYVVNGISKGWARGWRRRGWVKSDGKPALNPDLWGELLDLVAGRDITFHWVRGHAGDPLNERCDELAVAASHGQSLPADEGYAR